MRRREFISFLGGAAAAWPLVVRAQQPAKTPLVGYLTGDNPSADLPRRNAFRQGLRELKYVEGQSIIIEYRTSSGSDDKLSEFAGEFRRMNVNLVFAFSPAAIRAVANEMPLIPIVGVSADPVAAGLISSLARPGGNITGLSLLAGSEIYGKYLELLKDVVPNLTAVAFLTNPANPASATALKETEAAARALGLSIQVVQVRIPSELEAAFAVATKERVGGLLVALDAMFVAQRVQMAELTIKSGLPAIYGVPDHVEAGGLMAYAANRPEIYRRAATYVDKILKGAKPAELPVEQPTKFDLIINLKTAKKLGLTIPPTLLARANEVIE